MDEVQIIYIAGPIQVLTVIFVMWQNTTQKIVLNKHLKVCPQIEWHK